MRIVDGRLAGIGLATAMLTLGVAAKDYYCAPGGTGDYLSPSTPGGDPNYCSRSLAKTSGDVIHLAAGTYVLGSTPNVNQQIFLQPNVTLLGATDNPKDTVIDGAGQYRAACCYQGASIRNLTMSNCVTITSSPSGGDGFGFGGAVCAQSTGSREYVVSNCIVENCTSTYSGGAGYLGVWRDCVIRNCQVLTNIIERAMTADECSMGGCGGGVWGGDLYNCVVTNNRAPIFGGGIAGGTVGKPDRKEKYVCRAFNCLIGWNTGGAGGGAGVANTAWIDGMSNPDLAKYCQLSNCTVIGNVTIYTPGYATKSGGGCDRCILTGCRVEGNTAEIVGGGVNRSLLIDCVVCSNRTTGVLVDGQGGGGVSASTLTNCVVVGNSSYFAGGGLYNCNAVRTLIATNTLFASGTSGNETTGGAGAYGSVLTDCIVENNDSGIVFFGGAMNRCTVTNSIVRNNRGPYGGGGYDCDFVDCLITNNLAWQRSGGGVYRGTTRNCVIAFNYTTNNVVPDGNKLTGRGAICRGYHVGDLVYSNYYAKGAAVTCGLNDTDITIVNCTVYGNRSIYDANHNGFNCGYATNCIIVGHPNTDVYNIKALVNCFWQEDMVTHSQSDATLALAVNCIHGHGLDPRLDVAPTNGVLAVRVTSRSPCRNAGLAFDWMTNAVDLAGSPRICGKAPDIGAFEYPIERQATFMIVR